MANTGDQLVPSSAGPDSSVHLICCPNPECGHSFTPDGAASSVDCPVCGSSIPLPQNALATLPLPVIGTPEGVGIRPLEGPALKPPPATPTSEQVGRFEVRERLGEGAFGSVYRAYDPQLDREVALKVAKPKTVGTTDRRERFLREAKAAANLRHPNIVPVYDSGRDGDRYYIASGFIDGPTLRDEIEAAGDTPLGLARAVTLIRQLAEALAYSHRKGVFHRDVKPENVLLDTLGEPLLTDFGLASRTGDANAVPGSPADDALRTQEGRILGTPAYMSPEQAAGKSAEAGASADQYALGVMLFEMVTGQRPFDGPVEVVQFHHVETAPPPPRSLNRAISRDLEAVILRCLKKGPTERYGSCEELAEDLRRWQVGEPVVARPLNWAERASKWARRNPALATLFGVIIVGAIFSAVAAVSFKALADEEALARQNEETARRGEGLARLDEIAARNAETTAKNGEHTQRLKAEDRLVRSYLREANRYQDAGAPLTALPFSAEAYRLAVAADPTAAGPHQLRLSVTVAQAPRRERMLPHDHTPDMLACSPDGRFLVTAESYRSGKEPFTEQILGNVSIWDAATGERRAGPIPFEDPVVAVAFSPDCNRFVVGTGATTGRQGSGEAVILELPGGGRVCPPLRHPGLRKSDPGAQVGMRAGQGDWVRRNVGLITGVMFTPDGQRVVTCSDEGTARLWDVGNGEQVGEPLQHPAGVTTGVLTSDGATLITADDRSEVRVWDLGRRELRFDPSKLPIRGRVLGLHPKGTQVATADYSGGVKLWDLNTGKEVLAITGIGSGTIDRLEYAPDGDQLLVTERGIAATLWDISSDHQRLVHRFPHQDLASATFSLDGLTVTTTGKGIRFWGAKEGLECFPLLPDDRGVLHPDGHRVFTARDKAAWAWQFPPTVPYSVPSPVGREASSALALLSPDGLATLFAFLDDQEKSSTVYCELIDNATGRRLCPGWKHSSTRETDPGTPYRPAGGLMVAFRPDGELVATTCRERTVGLHATRQGVHTPPPLTLPSRAIHLAFRPNSDQIATISEDGKARLWDVSTGQLIGETLDGLLPPKSLAFSPDGNLLVAAGGNSSQTVLRVWDVTKRKVVIDRVSFPGESEGVWVWPNSGRLIGIGKTGVGVVSFRLHAWDLATGKPIGEPITGAEPKFSPDGDRFVLNGRIYDTQTMAPNTAEQTAVMAWHPTSGVAAVSVSLGQGEYGFRLSRLDGHPLTAGVSLPVGTGGLVFSPDARLVAAVTTTSYPRAGAELRLWDARTGDAVGFPRSVPEHSTKPRFTSDSRAVVLLTDLPHMGAWVLSIPVEAPVGPPEQTRGLARLLAGAGLDDTGTLVRLDVRAEWEAQAPGPESAPSIDQLRAWHLSRAVSCQWRNWSGVVYHLNRAESLGVNSPELAADLGRACLHLRRWAEARDAFTRAIDRGGTHWSIRAGRGQAFLGLKEWARALADLDAVTAAGGRNESVFLHRSSARAEAGDTLGAVKDATRAMKQFLPYDISRFLTPDVREQFRDDNWRTVHAYLTAMIDEHQRDGQVFRVPYAGALNEASAYAYRGIARFVLGNVDGAGEDFLEAARVGKNADAVYGFAESAADTRLRARPTDSHLLHLRGFARMRLGKSEAAVVDLLAATKADPKAFGPWLTLGDVYFDRGEWKNAADAFARAIASNPNPFPVAHLRRGNALAQQGEWQAAEAEFSRVTDIAPGWGTGWHALASLRLACGDAEGFREVLRRIRALSPTYPGLLRMWVWFAAIGDDTVDPKAMLAAILSVVGKKPSGFDRVRLGIVQYRAGQYGLAAATLAAIPDKEFEENPEACLVRALCAKSLGERKDAEKWEAIAMGSLRASSNWSIKVICHQLQTKLNDTTPRDNAKSKTLPAVAPPPRRVRE